MTEHEVVRLRRARLEVELRSHTGTQYLNIVSHLDPQQSFLLPLRQQALCGGLSLFTRIGRLHALHWALAYGAGPLPEGASIRFDPPTSRRQPSVSVMPQTLAGGCWWVADADGIFLHAVVVTAGKDGPRTPLTDSW